MAEPVTEARFHVWTYPTPTIVLGCSQRARQEALAAQLPPGLGLLVRPSGGGAVLTGPWMVSASVVLPLSHPWAQGRLPDSYRDLGQLHAEVLASLGVTAQALPEADVPAANARLGGLVDWACYGSLAPWELVDAAGLQVPARPVPIAARDIRAYFAKHGPRYDLTLAPGDTAMLGLDRVTTAAPGWGYKERLGFVYYPPPAPGRYTIAARCTNLVGARGFGTAALAVTL